MSESSSFIHNPNSNDFESLLPIDSNSATAICYEGTKDGKKFFMKQLRSELLNNIGYRILFRKEYELGSNISHENIVKYEQFFEDEKCCYILTEYICGETLDSFIDTHPQYFTSRSNLDKFFNQLLNALKCLHENHVVYSDLKPQNIIVSQINNDVKLIDLGFCFTDSYINTEGATQGFLAPEHIEKSKIDNTTDIYGIGKIIEYISERIKLPRVYRKIQRKCLKRRKSDRYQSVLDIQNLINREFHNIQNIVISSIVIILLYIGFRTLMYNEAFVSWWDGIELMPTTIKSDIEYRHINYTIKSSDSLTCKAVGASKLPNLRLSQSVEINGRGYKCTEISESAFSRNLNIKSVYIPEGIEYIGLEAFLCCENITNIELPNSVTSMGNNVFWGCKKLSTIKLSSSLKVIPELALLEQI